jgi:hypothetical protein
MDAANSKTIPISQNAADGFIDHQDLCASSLV